MGLINKDFKKDFNQDDNPLHYKNIYKYGKPGMYIPFSIDEIDD